MPKKKIGTEVIQENGGTLVLKCPRAWLAQHHLQLGTPLFAVYATDGLLRYYLEKQPKIYSRQTRLWLLNGNAVLTVGKDAANSLGIKKDSVVSISVDTDNCVLFVEKVKS